MRVYIVLPFLLLFSVFVQASEKACPSCDFVITEKSVNINNCNKYTKYFFENKKIGKSYEQFAAYFVPNHTYAEFWKRYLPDSNEKYAVDKKYVDGAFVSMFYEIIPKKIHIKEGKKANIEMVVDNERYYFQLKEVEKGTEISECYTINK